MPLSMNTFSHLGKLCTAMLNDLLSSATHATGSNGSISSLVFPRNALSARTGALLTLNTWWPIAFLTQPTKALPPESPYGL
jgi:hypothetical protein